MSREPGAQRNPGHQGRVLAVGAPKEAFVVSPRNGMAPSIPNFLLKIIPRVQPR